MRVLLLISVSTMCLVAKLPVAAADASRSGPTAQAPSPAPATSAMTNADVVKMVKAALGEDIIISAIRGTAERAFSLGADSLVQLKADGVSDRIIAVMLNPSPTAASSSATSPALSAPPPTPTAFGGTTVNPTASLAEVSLATSAGTQPIRPEGGEMSQTYAFVRMIVWANFRGLKSDVRTTERRPGVVVRTDEPKFDTRFMVVKTEPDDDDNVRSVRIRSGVYTFSTAFVPDSGWIIATTSQQESPGVWRMTLNQDLGRGEYGVLDTVNRYLYGFAVDSN